MGVPGNANALLLRSAAAAGGYQVSRSLRFNSSDSAYLSRTPASAGNRTTWTWAAWVKRSDVTSNDRQVLFSAYGAGNDTDYFIFGLAGATDSCKLFWTQWTVEATSTAVFRDPSAWYHIVANYNGSNLTFYVNNVQVLQSAKTGNLAINGAFAHSIGRNSDGTKYFSGYLADIYFIDGQALTPSSFTETDATTGQLVEKAYTGSYGSQGWHLEFADNSSNTATTLGKDTSGNGNNWTPNNLSVTAGAGNDSLVDTPTSYGTDTGAGGEVRGNYCTLNPLTAASGFTLSNGNLDISSTSASVPVVLGTIAVNSGKWYWEVTLGSSDAYAGAATITSRSAVAYLGAAAGQFLYNTAGPSSSWVNGNSYNYSTASSCVAGDVIGVALNFDANTITFYKNGVSQGTFSSNVLGTDTWAPAFKSNTAGASETFNFGQRPFAYTAPSGFKALCDTNLPAPVVAKPNTVMDVIRYTGTGANATIPNVNTVPTSIDFTPDLVWIKGRSGATDHALYDSVRDVQKDLVSNSTAAETTQSTGLTAFGTNNFNIGTLAKLNTSSSTYAAWCWDAGTTTSSNVAGSITSSVRANASAGFSVVTWTGQTAAGSIGHGLNAAPSLIICKARSNAQSWGVYHKDVGINNYLLLDSTGASTAYSGIWGSSAPTSTVFSVPGNVGLNNNNGWTYVGYCFAPVAGYSSFGSYVGNGSADGPFIYTGFRPKFILVKNTSVAGAWEIYDSVRNPYNVMALTLLPNASDAEITASNGVRIDFTSNGFKWRDNGSSINGSGNTIIWAAFAESPFQYARAR